MAEKDRDGDSPESAPENEVPETKTDARLTMLTKSFIDATMDALNKLQAKGSRTSGNASGGLPSRPMEANAIQDEFIKFWRQLLTRFQTNPDALYDILKRIENFVFPLMDADYITRAKHLFKTFYKTPGITDYVQERYRKMTSQFLKDYISTTSEGMLDEDTDIVMKKFINVLRASDNLEASLDTLSKNFESMRQIDESRLEEYMDTLKNYLHLEVQKKGDRTNDRTGEKRTLKIYKLPTGMLQFLEDDGIIGKNTMDKYMVKRLDVFDENLFYLMIYSHIIQHRETFDVYRIHAFVSYIAILYILSVLPVINTLLNTVDPEYMKEFNSSYGDNANAIGILPKSWLDNEFYPQFIKPLLELVAYFVGSDAWLQRITDDSQDWTHLQQQVKDRLKIINQWEKKQKVCVNIPIITEIRGLITPIILGPGAGKGADTGSKNP